MIKPLFQKILVMVTGTEASLNAAKYAVLMAKLYHCHIYAVYVVDTATIKQLTLNRIFIEEESKLYEKSLEENGRRYLTYVSELGKTKDVQIETELRRGSIWSEVVSFAEEKHIDVILMGGYDTETTDQRDIISSSFKRVLLNARCSVLVVKETMLDQIYKLA